jgi:hypothetical protein
MIVPLCHSPTSLEPRCTGHSTSTTAPCPIHCSACSHTLSHLLWPLPFSLSATASRFTRWCQLCFPCPTSIASGPPESSLHSTLSTLCCCHSPLLPFHCPSPSVPLVNTFSLSPGCTIRAHSTRVPTSRILLLCISVQSIADTSTPAVPAAALALFTCALCSVRVFPTSAATDPSTTRSTWLCVGLRPPAA